MVGTIVQYFGVAFAILPGKAGGLALSYYPLFDAYLIQNERKGRFSADIER
jgi:hypothetical protein